MSVMFLISSVFALINVQNWNIEYSGLAYLLIISGIIVFQCLSWLLIRLV